MLTTLTTVKQRLSILDTDTTYDALLTSTIQALSARFDKETNRTLARTENATHEFQADDTEISVACYPIETVAKFETKTTEAAGWQEVQPGPDYLIRRACIISLTRPLNPQPPVAPKSHEGGSTINCPLARATYTGGYILPGTTPAPGQTALPPDLENAAVEQIAFWFPNRDKVGLRVNWPKSGIYQQFATQDLLESVTAVLKRHARWTL